MIVMESLYQMAIKEGLDYYVPFVPRYVPYAIGLTEDGHSCGLKHPDGGPFSNVGNKRGKKEDEKKEPTKHYLECLRDHLSDRRTGNIAAHPLCDEPRYIFLEALQHEKAKKEKENAKDETQEQEQEQGGKKGKKNKKKKLTLEDKMQQRRDGFRAWAQEIFDHTSDPAVKAVLLYLDRLALKLETFPERLKWDDCKGRYFTFYYVPTGEYVMYRQAVRDYWKKKMLHAQQPGPHQCCVTGQMMGEVMEAYPKAPGIPGTNGGGTAIVSTNQQAFMSFGLDKNENYPLNQHVAEVLAIAFSRMCSSKFPVPGSLYPNNKNLETLPYRSIRLGENSIFCFWSDSQDVLDFTRDISPLLNVYPDAFREQTWKRMWSGKRPSMRGDIGHHNCEFIFGMMFTGADRPIFQSLIMHPILKFQDNIAQHFADTQMSRTATRKNREYDLAFSIKNLLSSCVPTKLEKKQSHEDRVILDYTQAIIDGTLYPSIVVQQALARYPMEFKNACQKEKTWFWRHRTDCLAALIKGHINRLIRSGKTTTKKECTEHMDHTRKEPAYALGCSLAIAGALQTSANEKQSNVTVSEMQMNLCKTSPRKGYDSLSEKVTHYLTKIRRNEDNYWGRYLTRLWHFWQHNMGGDLPKTFNEEERCIFLIGFHQTHAWLYNYNLRLEWLEQEGIPDILLPSNHEKKRLATGQDTSQGEEVEQEEAEQQALDM